MPSMLAFCQPEILGNRMEEWEFCLLWASPRKTVVIKPGGEIERYLSRSQNQGILASLQAEGWQTVAFDIDPTDDMTYLFKRQVKKRRIQKEPEHPSIYMPMQSLHQPPAIPHQ